MHDINKFILLLQKGLYPCEYMDDCEKFKQTPLSEKGFYSHLNMEDITDTDYTHANTICKDFEIKNLGEYHDLFVQRDTLLLANAFESLGNRCLEIYQLDLELNLTAPGLAW